MKPWMQIFIAMFAGIVTGLVVRFLGFDVEIFRPIGNVFLDLIRMLVVLLIFATMTLGITGINDPQKLGKIGAKTLIYYLGTTLLSIFVGIYFAKYFHLGAGFAQATDVSHLDFSGPKQVSDILKTIVPENPFAALVAGNAIQIIVFSCFLGVAINMSGERGRPLLDGIESLAEVMFSLTSVVMKFAPIGVFGIMAWVSGTMGIESLLSLGKFILVYYLACALFVVVVFFGILWGGHGLRPLPFIQGLWPAIVVAFSTGSSSATLPVSMRCIVDRLGVSRNIASFVVPLGSTINMNGTAIYQGMAAIFVAQSFGIDLDWGSILMIVFTATLSAIGSAGIPGQGFMMMSVVLSAVGLPPQGFLALLAVDRLRDMIGTVLNIMGDAVVAVAIAKEEGELDLSAYAEEELLLEGSEV